MFQLFRGEISKLFLNNIESQYSSRMRNP